LFALILPTEHATQGLDGLLSITDPKLLASCPAIAELTVCAPSSTLLVSAAEARWRMADGAPGAIFDGAGVVLA
jgi:hypothetical protein